MLILRRAEAKDEPLLLKWKNDPVAVEMSALQQTVDEEVHAHWFRDCLKYGTRLYIAEKWIDQGSADSHTCQIGMGRLNDPQPGVAVLSFCVAPEYRDLGYGGEIVGLLAEIAKKDGFHSILADVRKENTASLLALLRQGFTIQPVEMLKLAKVLR